MLADRDSEGETAAAHRQRPLRRIRQGSPEGRHGRAKPKVEEELEIVNRQADGGYLLGMSAAGDAGAPELYAMELQAEREATGRPYVTQLHKSTSANGAFAEMDEEDAKIARSYFASGCAFSGRSSKKLDQGQYSLFLPRHALAGPSADKRRVRRPYAGYDDTHARASYEATGERALDV